jgi:hypothetical protein
VTGRRRRKRKQLLYYVKKTREYWKLKQKALDRDLWRTRLGRTFGPVGRQTVELVNDDIHEEMWQLSLSCVW